jgi:hypothetical protein
VAALRHALQMREEGVAEAEIARRTRLGEGALARLGTRVKPVDVSGVGEWRVQEAADGR